MRLATHSIGHASGLPEGWKPLRKIASASLPPGLQQTGQIGIRREQSGANDETDGPMRIARNFGWDCH
ncbi:MAG TPA: hypothetical protein VN153_06550 [Tahibacter sp.]|nr:hypothetical protein [Tahibacter sp.]